MVSYHWLPRSGLLQGKRLAAATQVSLVDLHICYLARAGPGG